MFLVGRGIPERITSLPQTVLNTPFGQMLKPQLDTAMRSMTQAPPPPSSILAAEAVRPSRANPTNGSYPPKAKAQEKARGVVRNVSNVRDLDVLLVSASRKCAIIFFTSATCPPCKILYPAYDELAAEAGNRAVFIKVDIGNAFDVSSKYGISATPTFMTFLQGEKENEWAGADESRLRGNVRLLLQMARHPHLNLHLPNFAGIPARSVIYDSVPPLDKLMAKMGDAGHDPSVVALRDFVAVRTSQGAVDAPLPDLGAFSSFIHRATRELPQEVMWTFVDLLLAAMADPRCSGYYAEEENYRVITTILDYTRDCSSGNSQQRLQLVTLKMLCNLFSSALFPKQALADSAVVSSMIQLLSATLTCESMVSVRVAAASLAFNMASFNHGQRTDEDREIIPEAEQLQLLASLVEAVTVETTSSEALRRNLTALGLLIHCAPKDAEILDFVRAADVAGVVTQKAKSFPKEPLIQEIGGELLGKGCP